MKLVTHNLCQSPFKQRLQQSLNNQMSFGTNTAPVNMPDWSSITPPQNMPLWNNDYKANNEYMGQDQLTKNINDYDLTHRSLWQPSAATLSTTLNLPKSNGEKRKKTKEEKLASLGKTAETIGNISSIVSSVLPENTAYSGKYGNITKGLDTAYDGILSEVSKLGPIGQTVAGFGKLGGALSKFSSAIGLGTDGETAIDAIFSSGPLGFTPISLINGAFGKRTDQFYQDAQALAQIGSSYQGSSIDFKEATDKSNKKYGLFSSGARDAANDLIADAQLKMNKITNISENATNVLAQDGMANYQRYMLSQMGGPQATMVAKQGTKLKIKKVCNKVNKKLKGGIINPKPFEPVITLPTIEPNKFKQGGIFEPVITLDNPVKLQKGDKVSYKEWLKTVPKERLSSNYDLEDAYNTLPIEELEQWRKASDQELKEGKYHLPTVNSNPIEGRLYFYKLGKLENNPELKGEFDWYNSDDAKDFREQYEPAQFDEFKNRYYYAPIKHKEGGSLKESTKESNLKDKNVIPEGALHARKHGIENSKSLTQKGIPVVNDKGEQQAEIERDEVILNLKLTTKLEELQKQYEEASKTEQDKIAIEAGKLLVEELLHNTIDNTGLIDKCKKGGKINGPQ